MLLKASYLTNLSIDIELKSCSAHRELLVIKAALATMVDVYDNALLRAFLRCDVWRRICYTCRYVDCPTADAPVACLV